MWVPLYWVGMEAAFRRAHAQRTHFCELVSEWFWGLELAADPGASGLSFAPDHPL